MYKAAHVVQTVSLGLIRQPIGELDEVGNVIIYSQVIPVFAGK